MLCKENWKYVIRDGHPLVQARCPKCEVWGDVIDHNIDDEGFINPSVICECGFHAMVALKDFQREIKKGGD